MSIEPGGDDSQIEPLDIQAQFAQLRLDREERAKTKGYVEKEIGLGERVIRLKNLRKCTLSRCRVWLEATMPEDEYLVILDGSIEQNQDRLTKAEEEEKVVG